MMNCNWMLTMTEIKRTMIRTEAINNGCDWDEIDRIKVMDMKEVEAEFKALGLVYPARQAA